MHIKVHAWGSGFDEMADHLRSMIDEVQSGSFFRSHHPHSWKPALNLYETRDAFVVCVDLAGMSRERIDVSVADRVLHVRGVREKPVIPDYAGDVSVHLMEIDSGRFHRKVILPCGVAEGGVVATYRHGYLWITLPRAAAAGEAPYQS